VKGGNTVEAQAQAKAHLRYLRIAPRKVKIVVDTIRSKPVKTAMAILRHTPKAASEPLSKLLKSAMANAENNHNMDVDKLYVAEIFVDPGPTAKRVMPRARGSAFRILKRSSHVTVVLKEKE
jgi:large subunit ribosomal protein L22